MEKDPTTPEQALEETAAVLGEFIFEKQRQETVARMQAQRLAEREKKIEAQKHLIHRMLNRGKQNNKPCLRVVT